MQLKNKLQKIIFVVLVGLQIQSVSAIGMVHTLDAADSLKKLEMIVQQGCDRLGVIAKQNLCRAALLTGGVLFVYWGTRLIFEYLRPSTNYYERFECVPEQNTQQHQESVQGTSNSPQLTIAFLEQTLPTLRQRATPYCVALGSLGLGAACFWASWRL